MRPGFVRFGATALCVPALLAGAGARAQQATGQAAADIVEPLSLIKTRDLDFGRLIAGTTAGTAVISIAGARTTTGGTTAAGGTPQAAEFAGFGRRTQQITISFGAPSIQIVRSGGTETMTVDTFTIGASAAGGLNQLGNSGRWRITSATGIFTFPVGATLRVGANQAGGNYAGTFSVTVVYQ
jgi:hypothetical protein